MTQQITTKQAISNAISIKNLLLSEIQTNGKLSPQTDKIIGQVSDHPVEIVHLSNYCNKLDEKYNTDTALELRIELEIRHGGN